MQTLCTIGEAILDFIPESKGQRLKDVTSFKRVSGGAPANVAGAVAKLGGKAKFITKLGEDAFGDHMLECFNACNIDTSAILRTKDADTSLAFVSLGADGNRDFMFYRRHCADKQLAADEIKADALNECGMLHFCSVSLVESPIKYAHKKLIDMATQQGVWISFDPNLRLSLWEDEEELRSSVLEFMVYADILKISDEELSFISGYESIEEALPFFFQHRCKYLIYTMGKDGATIYRKDGTKLHDCGFTVHVRDTTGAGDSFIGAFLYQLLRHNHRDIEDISNEQLQQYLHFANAYGAYTTMQEGALDAMATATEIADFIQAYEHK